MPNYKTHDRVALITTPVIILAASAITPPSTAILTGAMFLLANHYLSPDLDIDSIMIRRWGLLYFIWWPYKKLFKHRSLWTHSGLLSGSIRFLYLLLCVSPLFLFITPPLYLLLLVYICMVVADTVHTIADMLL